MLLNKKVLCIVPRKITPLVGFADPLLLSAAFVIGAALLYASVKNGVVVDLPSQAAW